MIFWKLYAKLILTKIWVLSYNDLVYKKLKLKQSKYIFIIIGSYG